MSLYFCVHNMTKSLVKLHFKISWNSIVRHTHFSIQFNVLFFGPGSYHQIFKRHEDFIITRDSEVIMFSPCVFVCVWLSVYGCHDVCPDDLTMND